MADISPTLAREDGRKFGEHLVASKLKPCAQQYGGLRRVPAEVEAKAVADIEEAVQEKLAEKHAVGMSEKTLEIFRKQAWRAVEKGLNDLRREYRRG